MKAPKSYGHVCRRADEPGDCHIDERQQVADFSWLVLGRAGWWPPLSADEDDS